MNDTFLTKEEKRNNAKNYLSQKLNREAEEIEIDIHLLDEEKNEAIVLKNWSNLGRILIQLGEAYSQTNQKKISVDRLLLSYYIELCGAKDSGRFDPDDIFSPAFKPVEPDHSLAREIAEKIVKEEGYSYDDVMSYVNSFVGYYHKKLNFPISLEDFSLRIKNELFS